MKKTRNRQGGVRPGAGRPSEGRPHRVMVSLTGEALAVYMGAAPTGPKRNAWLCALLEAFVEPAGPGRGDERMSGPQPQRFTGFEWVDAEKSCE